MMRDDRNDRNEDRAYRTSWEWRNNEGTMSNEVTDYSTKKQVLETLKGRSEQKGDCMLSKKRWGAMWEQRNRTRRPRVKGRAETKSKGDRR